MFNRTSIVLASLVAFVGGCASNQTSNSLGFDPSAQNTAVETAQKDSTLADRGINWIGRQFEGDKTLNGKFVALRNSQGDAIRNCEKDGFVAPDAAKIQDGGQVAMADGMIINGSAMRDAAKITPGDGSEAYTKALATIHRVKTGQFEIEKLAIDRQVTWLEAKIADLGKAYDATENNPDGRAKVIEEQALYGKLLAFYQARQTGVAELLANGKQIGSVALNTETLVKNGGSLALKK